MSERLTPERLAEIRERRDRAFDMISALCRPKGSPGSREWIMSIPARPDHDPDLVIGAALKDIDALLAHIDAQAEEIERLRRERDTLDSGLDGLEQAIQYRDWPAVVAFLRAARKLLDAKNGGGQYE